MPAIDFSGVEDRVFEAIPAAKYPGRVTKCEMGTSNRSDEPKIDWEFAIVGGEHEGRKMFLSTSLKKSDDPEKDARWGSKRVFKALGFTDEQLSGEFEWEDEDVIGKDVDLIIGKEKYEGEMRNRVRRVLPVGTERAPF